MAVAAVADEEEATEVVREEAAAVAGAHEVEVWRIPCCWDSERGRLNDHTERMKIQLLITTR